VAGRSSCRDLWVDTVSASEYFPDGILSGVDIVSVSE